MLAPVSVESLLEMRAQHPSARILAGASEVYVERKGRRSLPTEMIYVGLIKGMKGVTLVGESSCGVSVGAGVRLSDLEAFLDAHEDFLGVHALSLRKTLRIFASSTVRNTATLGGNVANASPVSDTLPLLLACNGTVTLASKEGERDVPAREWVVGYRRTAMRPDEVVVRINVPQATPRSFTAYYKLARRMEDDISTVGGCFSLTLDTEGKVAHAGMAFSGMAAVTKCFTSVESLLVGKDLSAKGVLSAAIEEMKKVSYLPIDVPGGLAQYRSGMCVSLLTKFVYQACNALNIELDEAALYSDVHRTVVDDRFSTVTRGEQHMETGNEDEADAPVNKSIPHATAHLQARGQAEYVSTSYPGDAFHCYPALANVPHGTLDSIDIERALMVPGVQRVLLASDIPGSNHVGVGAKDERILVPVGEEITSVGQAYALVIADTHETAHAAAGLITASITRLPAITTIEEAIKADSYLTDSITVERNVSTAEEATAKVRACPVTVEGSFTAPGQEHFYLETHSATARWRDGGIQIHAGTQHPNATQGAIADMLVLPQSRVEAYVTRIGGAFGGKEGVLTYSCFSALAAWYMKRSVSFVMERSDDLAYTGKRHEITFDYKIGCAENGKIQAMCVSVRGLGGHCLDLSGAVMERCILHMEGCYHVPVAYYNGRQCKTHTPSGTAFRGFGAPQSTLCMEHIMDRLAEEYSVKVSPITHLEFRMQNLIEDGQETVLGHPCNGIDPARDMKTLLEDAKILERQRSVSAWNATHPTRKRGLAVSPVKFGIAFTQAFLNQGYALVHIYKDGSVLVSHGGIEMGQGIHSKMLQVAANALGVPIEMCHIWDSSTASCPNTSPTSASSGSDLNGLAILDACRKLREQLSEYYVKYADPDNEMTWAQLCNAAWFNRTCMSAVGFYKMPIKGYSWQAHAGEPFAYYAFGAAAVEVEVDTLTGENYVRRTDIIYDAGRPLNPALDIGQIEGAFVQAQGWLTTEEFVWQEKKEGEGEDARMVPNGVPMSRGPGTYKVPAALDVPQDFRVSFVKDSFNPKAPFGSKGIGEPPFCLGQAVYLALRRAVNAKPGASELECPSTMAKVWSACEGL
ncbi:aldehyde oxidase/xanthine dehydrogenase [Kipferlia bialata]|nr:aldehyde oxidase/xanthine dehydrogenase [Kipferlia bialata]GIQ85903.1 aldehyde oxidase/xanthine dehydrogenase [Kipferlia bialata]|eukprot:g3604.t1